MQPHFCKTCAQFGFNTASGNRVHATRTPHRITLISVGFNTASGNRVHATLGIMDCMIFISVSIPQAVIGCMQLHKKGFLRDHVPVSIPQAVIGCMQHYVELEEALFRARFRFNTASGNRVHATNHLRTGSRNCRVFQYRKR